MFIVNNIKAQLEKLDTEERIDFLFETKQVKTFLELNDYGFWDCVLILRKSSRQKIDPDLVKNIWKNLALVATIYTLALLIMAGIGFLAYPHVNGFVGKYFQGGQEGESKAAPKADGETQTKHQSQVTSPSSYVPSEKLQKHIKLLVEQDSAYENVCKDAEDEKECESIVIEKTDQEVEKLVLKWDYFFANITKNKITNDDKIKLKIKPNITLKIGNRTIEIYESKWKEMLKRKIQISKKNLPEKSLLELFDDLSAVVNDFYVSNVETCKDMVDLINTDQKTSIKMNPELKLDPNEKCKN
jgi:hypothetical protein